MGEQICVQGWGRGGHRYESEYCGAVAASRACETVHVLLSGLASAIWSTRSLEVARMVILWDLLHLKVVDLTRGRPGRLARPRRWV